MAAQITNGVLWEDGSYAICGVQGEGLFDPAPKTNGSDVHHTCRYIVQDGQLRVMTTDPEGDVFSMDFCPDDGNLSEDVFVLGPPEDLDAVFDLPEASGSTRVDFTGSLLLGKRFITNIQLNSGFPPPYTFRDVIELTFDRGVLTGQVDRSEEMLEARIELATDGNSGWKEPDQWVEGARSLEY